MGYMYTYNVDLDNWLRVTPCYFFVAAVVVSVRSTDITSEILICM